MRRFGAIVAVAIVATACGSDGVTRADYDLVTAELARANQELALAAEELAVVTGRVAIAEEQAAEAAHDVRAAEARIAELESEIEGLFTIDDAEEAVMDRQQSLAALGTRSCARIRTS